MLSQGKQGSSGQARVQGPSAVSWQHGVQGNRIDTQQDNGQQSRADSRKKRKCHLVEYGNPMGIAVTLCLALHLSQCQCQRNLPFCCHCSYVGPLTQDNNVLSLHNFFLSLVLLIRCILSLSQAFLNNTELKIFGRHQESNPGPLVQRTSTLPLSYNNHPANKHSNSVFILLRGTAMLQSHSQQTN